MVYQYTTSTSLLRRTAARRTLSSRVWGSAHLYGTLMMYQHAWCSRQLPMSSKGTEPACVCTRAGAFFFG